jgi:hypothetical protein
MKMRTSKHYVEIFPAALLSQRRVWQTLSDNLPEGAWLLILRKEKNEVGQVIIDLAKALEQQGKRVILV